MENQNRIQALFNKQVDNQEYSNSQLAENITNIQQFTNKPLPYDLQLNAIHNDTLPPKPQTTNPCVKDQSNHLIKRLYDICNDANEEMTPHKKFKSIQEESSNNVNNTTTPHQIEKYNTIKRHELKINKATRFNNLEELLQLYTTNSQFHAFMLDLKNLVDELIALIIKELDRYELKSISIDDVIEKLKFLMSLKKNLRHRLYCSLYENKNTFDFYSTLSKENKISKYVYCLLTILEDIKSSHLQKYFHLISISNKILPIINQFFNEDTCNMYSKLIELKKLLWQVPHINSYSLILDRPMLEKYGVFFISIYKTSLDLLFRSVSKKKRIQDNELQSIEYIEYRKFDIKTLIMFYHKKNKNDRLIYDLRDFTNQIIIAMKKEIFSSESQCFYNAIDINSVIEEIKTINAINKANTVLTREAQYRRMKSIAKENTKEKSFYTTLNPKNRILNLISILLGIVEIIDHLDKKILEDKVALEEIVEDSKNVLHHFFNPKSLTNEKIIELKNLLFQISSVQSNRSIFKLDCIKHYAALVACVYETQITNVWSTIQSVRIIE